MFNLYADAIDRDGFMGIVSKKSSTSDKQYEVDSRGVVSDFTVASLLILFLISGSSVYQTNNETQRHSVVTSYTSVI